MKRAIIKLARAAVASAIYAVILWYSITTADEIDGPVEYGIIAVISLGIAYGVTVAVFRVASETGEVAMVLAKYLNQHLLEPLKEQQRAEGEERGRSAERERIRRHLQQQGYDPDALLPPPEADDD